MNTVASLISGQFTRSLILGSFFPVVLFLFLASVTIYPLLPQDLWVVAALQGLDTQGRVGAISVAAIVATVFLYNLNTPIIRLLEGYPWKDSTYGQARIAKWQKQYEGVTALLPRLRTLRSEWDGIDKNDPQRQKVQDALNRLQQLLNVEYPSKPSLILPTRFGNVLRSFETYSLRQYAMDGVVFWPRIVSVVDKETMGMVEDARSSLDFFVNCTVLSGLLAGALFVLGCCELNGATPSLIWLRWLVETAAAATGAGLFYGASLGRIAAWGAQVKSVFDLFRGDLLKKLGYTQTFSTREQERAVWGELSRQAIYGDPTRGTTLPYAVAAEPRTAVSSDSKEAIIELTGGVKKEDETVIFYYRATNTGKVVATKVVMTERLMDGFSYVWGSLKRDGQAGEVTGANPYAIQLGDLQPGMATEIVYSAVDLRA